MMGMAHKILAMLAYTKTLMVLERRWEKTLTEKQEDRSGVGVGIRADGARVIIGAPYRDENGAVNVYRQSSM